MDENEVNNLINTVDLVEKQMVQKQELSTISVAVELTGMDQVNDEIDKMLIKLEKANSLADELTSKLKTYGIDGNEIARAVSETIHTEERRK